MANDVTTEAVSDDPVTGDGTTRRPASRRQRFESVRNMVLSMVVICAGVFALVLLNPEDQPEGSVPTREYDVEAATAARAAPYELVVPEGLSGEWGATSVRYEPLGEFGATWRLGFLDPEEEYVALTQADGEAGEFITDVTRGAEATDAVERIGGREWARYEGPKYDALVLQEPEVTTVVMGTAPFEQLTHFAQALRPVD